MQDRVSRVKVIEYEHYDQEELGFRFYDEFRIAVTMERFAGAYAFTGQSRRTRLKNSFRTHIGVLDDPLSRPLLLKRNRIPSYLRLCLLSRHRASNPNPLPLFHSRTNPAPYLNFPDLEPRYCQMLSMAK